jgi:hypothetical protein
MNVFHWLPWHFLYDIESLSDRVADLCHLAVLERVLPEVAEMAAPEAGGYIRARAAGLVADQTQRLLAELGAPEELGPQLVAQTKDRIIGLILNDLRKAKQAPQAERRAA